MIAKVTAECVSCKHRESYGPGEVPADDYPLCPKCYCPMVAVKAEARRSPSLKKG